VKLRYKIGLGILGVLAVAIVSLALVLSYEASCEPVTPVAANVETIRAITGRCYGPPDVLALEELEKPAPVGKQLLIKVKAAGVNPLDWHYMRGSPYIMRLGSGIGAPKEPRLGVDFAGIVEAVGEDVTLFSPGDAVFGGKTGAFAEYVVMEEDRAVVHKPDNVSFEHAAAVPIAAITALQAVRDSGGVNEGDTVLINGASGGVGTYAVQIAKSMGAEVHGVCSTRNVEMVTSLGADRVFDYKKENYTQGDVKYDVIIDNVGNHSLMRNRRVMADDGILVIVGGSPGDWLGPLMRPLGALIVSPMVSQQFSPFLAQISKDDLQVLADLMANGEVSSVIDRRYPLHEVPEAISYSESGRARGKIIVTVDTGE
jgi:NADPH:quinone reductase-like Zn-dependent oxidoreductase